MAGYRFYDGNIVSYEVDQKGKSFADLDQQAVEKYSSNSFCAFEFSSFSHHVEFNSMIYEISDEVPVSFAFCSIEASFIHALYEEGSGSNKRPHYDEFVSTVSVSVSFALTFYQLVDLNRQTRKKPQKRVEKKTEPQSLIDIFDESFEIYDKSISIRQILKANKMNMI